MKVDKITISYSSDKLQALRVLKPEVYSEIEKTLQDCIEKLYVRYISISTRQYIEAKIQDEESSAQKGGSRMQ